MNAWKTWLPAAFAIAAILAGALLPLAGVGRPAAGAADLGILALAGIVIVVALTVWRTGRGRSAVAPVPRRFGALVAAIGVVFATAAYAVGAGGGDWSVPEGRWCIMAMAVLVWSMGWISTGIGRNRLIGFRTPRTLSDDDAWVAANRRFGRALMWGAPLSLFGLLAGDWGPAVAFAPALAVGVAFLWSDRRAAR